MKSLQLLQKSRCQESPAAAFQQQGRGLHTRESAKHVFLLILDKLDPELGVILPKNGTDKVNVKKTVTRKRTDD